MKISEGSFSDFRNRFVLDGYGGFQDKARECGIDELDFSIGMKHKRKSLIRRISLLSAQKTSGEYTRILCWKITLKNTSL